MLSGLSKKQQALIKNLGKSRTYRTKHQCFYVEGLKNVQESMESDFGIKYIVVSKSFLEQNGDFIKKAADKIGENRIFQTSDQVYKELSDTVTPQGVLALVEYTNIDIYNIAKENFFLIALDRVQDPGNMGTIIRTADAAGLDAVIMGKGCVDVYSPKVVRSTMGSLFHIPFINTEDLVKELVKLKKMGGKVITTHLSAKKHYYDVDYDTSTIIVMGSEDEGVSEEITNISDVLVKIEMPGKAESLNVAVANGIMVFEAVKQRVK